MKKYLTILSAIAVVASANALPYKKADLGAIFDADTKPIKQTSIHASDMASRADDAWIITQPIFEVPEGGDYYLYRRQSEMIYYTMNGLVMASDDYFAGEVVFYKNGDVYLRNMIPSMISDSYLKGTYADGKITIPLPQALCYDQPFYDEDGNLVEDSIWPVFRGDYEISQVWDEEWEEYVGTIDVWVDENSQTLTFTVAEDGTITQDEGGVLGVFTQGGIWYGEAAWEYKFEPFNETPNTMPEGIEVNNWAFYDVYDSSLTQVAIDGEDFYWQGFYKPLSKSVVKGKIDGTRIILESPTYIGIDPVSMHLAYFAGTETVNNRLKISKTPRLTYDPEKNQITYPRKYLIVNSGPETINLIAQYNSPTLQYQPADVQFAAPQTPIIQWVSEFEYDPMSQMNTWFTVIDIPNIDVNGHYLDKERMWYNFYFDDELFWFDMDDYQLVADSPDVPYTYNDSFNIYYSGTYQHGIYFYWTGYRKMTVQSIFEDEQGNLYKSEMAEYINPNASISDIDVLSEPVTVIYYDIQGRKISNPKGLCVKQSVYADGKVNISKVIIK